MRLARAREMTVKDQEIKNMITENLTERFM
jgi:hypothetical protein